MGQNKFEDQMRRQLREREITPSPAAWERLNERLEKEDKKSRSYYWIAGIAASFAAGILILSLVFTNDVIDENPAVVDTPVESIEKTNEDFVLDENEEKEESLNYDVEQIAAEELKETEAGKADETSKENFAESIHQEAAIVEEIKEEQVIENEIAPNGGEKILPQRLEEVIAEVTTEVNAGEEMTEDEVDALLYKAAAEISLERDRENFSKSIDATALLRDVEMELDQEGFREKVFDLLKDGYLKAKTAVANRNF